MRRRGIDQPPDFWAHALVAAVAAVLGAGATFMLNGMIYWLTGAEPFSVFGLDGVQVLFVYAPVLVGTASVILATFWPDCFADAIVRIWGQIVKSVLLLR